MSIAQACSQLLAIEESKRENGVILAPFRYFMYIIQKMAQPSKSYLYNGHK